MCSCPPPSFLWPSSSLGHIWIWEASFHMLQGSPSYFPCHFVPVCCPLQPTGQNNLPLQCPAPALWSVLVMWVSLSAIIYCFLTTGEHSQPMSLGRAACISMKQQLLCVKGTAALGYINISAFQTGLKTDLGFIRELICSEVVVEEHIMSSHMAGNLHTKLIPSLSGRVCLFPFSQGSILCSKNLCYSLINSGAQMWKRSVPAVRSVSHKCMLRAEGFFYFAIGAIMPKQWVMALQKRHDSQLSGHTYQGECSRSCDVPSEIFWYLWAFGSHKLELLQ